MSITYRPATQTDAAKLAEITILAGQGVFELLLKNLKRKVSVEAVMTELCRVPNTEYSYMNFTVAEVDGEVAGGINTIAVADRYKLAPNINPILREKFHFGIIQLIRFLFRARHLKGMNEIKSPRSSLHINDIAVLPKYQGLGIAKHLVESTIAEAKRRNLEFVSLYVWGDNAPAISLYQKLGFEISKKAQVRAHRYLPHTESLLMLYRVK